VVDLATSFDSGRAIVHIAELSGPRYAGREAGTPGAQLAAAYIAEQFASLGLQPAGEAITVGGELGYLGWQPITYTHLVATPVATFLDADGDLLLDLAYREDSLERGGQGAAEGELIWLNSSELEGLSFGGAVVMERDVSAVVVRARQLELRGAGGLVVVNGSDTDELQVAYSGPDAGSEAGIPVMEMTDVAFDLLLDRAGLRLRDLTAAPPTLPLDVYARLSIERSPVTTTLAANVLGLLPGSDAELADEYLIVGAHYDHIGMAPNGFYFPGANRNASGVAAMLELARVWQAAGFRPARSVLFVAWGTGEQGDRGARPYLEHPAIPPTQTIGVIAADSIAAGEGYRLMYTTREQDTELTWPLETGATHLGHQVRRSSSGGDGWPALFRVAGVPTIQLTWERAEDGFYLPSDTVDNIEVDKLTTSGEILTLAVSWLASR
jgi:hypothetical protein